MDGGTTTAAYQSQESIAESALGLHNLHQFVYYTLYETALNVLHIVAVEILFSYTDKMYSFHRCITQNNKQ